MMIVTNKTYTQLMQTAALAFTDYYLSFIYSLDYDGHKKTTALTVK